MFPEAHRVGPGRNSRILSVFPDYVLSVANLLLLRLSWCLHDFLQRRPSDHANALQGSATVYKHLSQRQNCGRARVGRDVHRHQGVLFSHNRMFQI